MPEWLMALETFSKALAFLSGAGVLIGALIQYSFKLREERRLKDLAVLETDVKISQLFAELVSTANGYGKWSEPQAPIMEEILQALPKELKQQIVMANPQGLGQAVSGARVPTSVPLSQQLAAAEAIASLAIRYRFLLEAALVGLDVVVGFLPQAKPAYDRLCTFYRIERPLTRWDFSRGPSNLGAGVAAG